MDVSGEEFEGTIRLSISDSNIGVRIEKFWCVESEENQLLVILDGYGKVLQKLVWDGCSLKEESL